jgi:hypothetical protein
MKRAQLAVIFTFDNDATSLAEAIDLTKDFIEYFQMGIETGKISEKLIADEPWLDDEYDRDSWKEA